MNKSMTRRFALCLPCAAMALGATAHGQAVGFDNFAPGMGYNPDLPQAAVRGPLAANWAHGILFTAQASGGITSMDVALRHEGGANDFIVRVQADDGGVPGQILGAWFNVEGFPIAGDPPVHVPADGTVELVEGTSYWFVLWGAGDSDGRWHETTLSDPGLRAWGQQGGTNWSVFSVSRRYAFRILLDEAGACYANCDGSPIEPILSVDDFTCFINEFAAAQQLPHEQQIEHYANCDGSTNAPVLTVDDFTCFINAFAAGCP